MIVVDASLFAAWLLNEPGHGPDDAVWDSLAADTLLVPCHWPNEIANALRKAVRTKRLRADEIEPIAERVTVFDIGFAEPTRPDQIGNLCKEALDKNLSVYDMAYLLLALEHQLPLATVDQAMRAVAKRMQVTLLPA